MKNSPLTIVALPFTFACLICECTHNENLWPITNDILSQCMNAYEGSNDALAIRCFVALSRILSGAADPMSQQGFGQKT